jgi:glycosyltransferase involved in cell wall biosynthesis
MKIGIILHPYDEDKPAGLARTIFEWTKGMLEVDEKNEYVIFVKKKPRKIPELPGNNWRVEDLGGGRLWLERLRSATPVDVMIFNTPVMPFFWKPKKSIIIALDYAYWYLSPKTLKGQLTRFFTHIYYWLSFRRADKIVAISQATKDETVHLFGVPKEKIKVIYCGFKKMCALPQKEIALPEKFFLFVGVIKPRKNVFNIVRSFNQFQKTHKDFSLVLAGKMLGDYFEKIKHYVEHEKITERVVFLNFPTDEELSYTYRRAHAFVFPTLIEGFGYPVLEAIDCGIPVITSNISSLKEVGGGGAALLVDPYSVEDIAGAMTRLEKEEGLRDELIEKGALHAQNFSWQGAGRELIAFVKK